MEVVSISRLLLSPLDSRWIVDHRQANEQRFVNCYLRPTGNMFVSHQPAGPGRCRQISWLWFMRWLVRVNRFRLLAWPSTNLWLNFFSFHPGHCLLFQAPPNHRVRFIFVRLFYVSLFLLLRLQMFLRIISFQGKPNTFPLGREFFFGAWINDFAKVFIKRIFLMTFDKRKFLLPTCAARGEERRKTNGKFTAPIKSSESRTPIARWWRFRCPW